MSKNEKRLPDDVVEAKPEAPVAEEKTESKKSNIERWWTKEGPSYSIVGKTSPDAEPSMISMKDYVMELDVSTVRGKQLSNDFRTNQFAGISVFLIVPKDDKSPEGQAAAKELRRVVDNTIEEEKLRGLKHVAAIFDEEEARAIGVNRHHPEKPELVEALYSKKSFLPKSKYKELHKI